MMLGKRKLIQAVRPPSKKGKSSSAIEEISFDFSAREDYLTGFHKRKLLRIKQAKEEAAKKDHENKLAARKILREGRKVDLDKHVEAVNLMIREADAGASDPSKQEDEGEKEPWDGIKDRHDLLVNHEDEYMDEDRFTTVTVEAVDVSKDGLQKAVQDEENESEALGTDRPDRDPQSSSALQGRTGSGKGKRIWTKETPTGPKKRKKKFRYENKAERKATRYKERSGNKAKARARKQ
ncbi:MAG: pre-60S ribosomal particles component [Alectoria sarmentosa]|nr:MAG: pre-60S ribosomal particles component [Alectoria sarmentosa]